MSADPYIVSARDEGHFQKLCAALKLNPEKSIFVPYHPDAERLKILQGRCPSSEAKLVGPFTRVELALLGLISLRERLQHAIFCELFKEIDLPRDFVDEMAQTYSEWIDQAVEAHKQGE